LLVARALSGSTAGRWSLAVPALTLVLAGVAALAVPPMVAAAVGGGIGVPWFQAGGATALLAGLWLASRHPAGAPRDVRRVAAAATVAMAGLLAGFDGGMRERYELGSVADHLARFEAEGRTVAVEGKYHGQWTFAGRLRRALVELPEDGVSAWLAAQPQRRVVLVRRHLQDLQDLPAGLRIEYSRRYRGGWVAIVAAE
jgi:hypothetical protein